MEPSPSAASCCETYWTLPTTGGKHGNVKIGECRCHQSHVCPICAAAEAEERATLIEHLVRHRKGPVYSVVLTQRDLPPGAGSCRSEWRRLLRAVESLTRGKHAKWFRKLVVAAVFCLETTGGKSKKSWHPHLHTLIEFASVEAAEEFKAGLESRWVEATTEALDEATVALFNGDTLAAAETAARLGYDPLPAQTAADLGWSKDSGFDWQGRERWFEQAIPAPPEGKASPEEAAK